MSTRRRFLKQSTALTATLAVAGPSSAADDGPALASRWNLSNDRVWLGPEFWANPLQDWRVANGRIECVNAAADRNVHLLTRQLGEKAGTFVATVRLGRVDGKLNAGKGSAGFRVGIQGPLKEY